MVRRKLADMSASSEAAELLGRMAEAVDGVEAKVISLDVTLRGNGNTEGVLTRLSHVERSCRELKEAMGKAEGRLTVNEGEVEQTSRARWRAVAEIVVAIAALGGIALQLYGRANP